MLLLVAPAEHKVRVEVGYGLEGALSSVIISSAVTPRFKAGDFSGGIERGVDGIINVLSGDSAGWQSKVDVRREDASADFEELFPFLFFLMAIFVCWYLIHHAGGGPTGRGCRRARRRPLVQKTRTGRRCRWPISLHISTARTTSLCALSARAFSR